MVLLLTELISNGKGQVTKKQANKQARSPYTVVRGIKSHWTQTVTGVGRAALE